MFELQRCKGTTIPMTPHDRFCQLHTQSTLSIVYQHNTPNSNIHFFEINRNFSEIYHRYNQRWSALVSKKVQKYMYKQILLPP